MYVKGTREVPGGLLTLLMVNYGLYSQPDRNLGDRYQVVKPMKRNHSGIYICADGGHNIKGMRTSMRSIPHGLRCQKLIGGDVSLWLALKYL